MSLVQLKAILTFIGFSRGLQTYSVVRWAPNQKGRTVLTTISMCLFRVVYVGGTKLSLAV